LAATDLVDQKNLAEGFVELAYVDEGVETGATGTDIGVSGTTYVSRLI
jgi:hypothetical protein